MAERIMGVDGCRTGWIGLVLDGAGIHAYGAATIRELVEAARADGPLAVVGIDIPIGLPDRGRRRADNLARAVVGPRRAASVFITPVRPALRAGTYAEAARLHRTLAGQGLSRQAFALRTKILQVDEWVRTASIQVVEVHPEVSFATMAGSPLGTPKRTWTGTELRRRLLADHGIEVPADLGAAGALAAVDDVLDAAAAAWSARRVAAGSAELLPDPPETFGDGLPCAVAA